MYDDFFEVETLKTFISASYRHLAVLPLFGKYVTWGNTLRNGQLYAESTFILQFSVQQPIIEHLTLHGLCPAWVVGIIWSQNPQ